LGHSIAVAGKGGTGKTSFTAIMLRYLLRHRSGPILAVDADANANLGESLGLKPEYTVGMILDDFKKDKINIPAGLSKEAYLEMKLNDALLEGKRLDLLTMGHGEGPDCYCYPNLMLRKFQDILSGNYDWVVMDNEAGLEHLSRRTTQNIDDLFLVSNHSVKAARTLERIRELVGQLRLNVSRQWVIVNQVPGQVDELVSGELARIGIKEYFTIPQDTAVYEADLHQVPLTELPEGSPAVDAVNSILENVLNHK